MLFIDRMVGQILTAILATMLSVEAFAQPVTASAMATAAATEAVAPRSIPKKPSLTVKQRQVRLIHAKELLGSHYKKSSVRKGESVKKINSLVYSTVKERLSKDYQKKRQKIAQAIIDEAFKYRFDPVFLLSVIQSESSFRPKLHGSFGEIGLMQIKPSTAEWIAKKMNVKYKGADDLYDPVQNIRVGAAFLSYLRDRFDSHAQLYLSAYNMGQRNVDNALEKNIWPKDYVERVMRQYVDFYAALPKQAPGRTSPVKSAPQVEPKLDREIAEKKANIENVTIAN